MTQIVILGAGTGGALIANMLAQRLDLNACHITVIDRATEHVYQPGLIFLPFKLYGYTSRDDLTRPITQPLPKGVTFVQAGITAIDHARNKVVTEAGEFAYDGLICALGCHIAVEEVGGLEELIGKQAYTFYTLDHALKLQEALDKMRSGRLVLDIAEMPIKCPVAPIEFVFLADYYFQLRGIREQIEITLVTPFSGAFTKPVANQVLSRIAEEKGIHIIPDFSIERVEASSKEIVAYDGRRVPYDLLCIIPPNLGPEVVQASGLGTDTGYALTHPRTLKSQVAENIYFLGDNTNVTTSKAGSVAHFEAETVVENLMREMQGLPPNPSFDGHANCFIESGHHKALLLDFNYDVEPLKGDFPLPHLGPFTLLEESHINHLGKLAFKWIYWHMLLPGYLPKVPLLPSHMSFLGKDASTMPAVRHARATLVEAVMSKAVISVTTGTALGDAARLMEKHRISGLPVVDMQGALIGIITEADFLSAIDVAGESLAREVFDAITAKTRGRKRMGSIVDDLMSARPLTLQPDDTVQKAIETMLDHGVKRLPVIDADHRVVGIVARADLMKVMRV